MTFTPRCPSAGWILPPSTFRRLPSSPIILGTFGPVMSISSNPTLSPFCASESASPVATVDFPTPPFPDRTIILCLIVLPISDIAILRFI